jgi:basic membrane lipoprotein Med (substrate-binding protein (PBP1-ABC) superfamily)
MIQGRIRTEESDLAMRRKNQVIGAVAAIALGALSWLGFALFSGSEARKPAAPVSRIDLAGRVCLAASPDVDASAVSAIGSRMRKAPQVTAGKIVFQQFSTPDGVSAATYLDTLTQMRCATIVTVGERMGSAVPAVAEHQPKTHFVVVGGSPVHRANVTSLTASQISAQALISVVTA